ncbi:major capsid protein [Marinobacterium iners]|uniref:Bacteriophage coat protein B n=1 Tax=Marinobacterium iners DSM 11526 TaxID=1122198 RepID=A0A1H4GT12_9GAMM|nr:major capsid protein [Marinobacterium iners]SEB11998.1 hypothetical protein SAMN02745729_11935 [Marinobacterium iners DSM 11526]
MKKSKWLKAGAVAGAVMSSAAANASVLTAESQASLEQIVGDITIVGGIIIGAAAVYASFRWVKRGIGM